MTDNLRTTRSGIQPSIRHHDDPTYGTPHHHEQSQARADSSTGLNPRTAINCQDQPPPSRLRRTLTQLSSSLTSCLRSVQPAQTEAEQATVPPIREDIQERQPLVENHPVNQINTAVSVEQNNETSILQSVGMDLCELLRILDTTENVGSRISLPMQQLIRSTIGGMMSEEQSLTEEINTLSLAYDANPRNPELDGQHLSLMQKLYVFEQKKNGLMSVPLGAVVSPSGIQNMQNLMRMRERQDLHDDFGADQPKSPGTAASQQLDNFVERGEKFTTEKRDPKNHQILYKPEERHPETGEITRKANTIPLRVKDEARIKHMHKQIETRVQQQLNTANFVGEDNVSIEMKTARVGLMLAAMELINQQVQKHSSNMALVSRLIHEVDKDFPLPEGHPESGAITLEDAAKFANDMLAFGGFYERVKPKAKPEEPEATPPKP
jgi:hypothetical protein